MRRTFVRSTRIEGIRRPRPFSWCSCVPNPTASSAGSTQTLPRDSRSMSQQRRLSGVLTGWSQLPIELRASHLDTTVSTRIAIEANAVASNPAWNAKRPTDSATTVVQVGRDGEAVFLTSASERPLFERSYRLPLAELIHRLELRSDSPALLDLANAAGWVDECIVTVVDDIPWEAEGGQEGTVFAGIPMIKQRVLVGALRDLVASQGLPPASDRLRSRLIEEHFSATEKGTGDIEAEERR